MPEVSVDEWLAELERLEAAIDGQGVTSGELGEAWKLGKEAVLKRLHVLIREGRVECVRVRRSRIDGLKTVVPAYRQKQRETI